MEFSKASFNGMGHVALSLTDRCNRRCTYCYLTEQELSCCEMVDVPALLSNLERLYRAHRFRLVTIAGGEPALVPNLEAIVESIAAIGFEIIINTNGTLSAQRIRRLRDFNIKAISFSFDSTDRGVNDRLRFPGSYELVHSGVSFCREEHIPVRISSVICQANKDDVIGLYNWCDMSKVDVLNIHELDTSLSHSFMGPLRSPPKEWRELIRSLVAHAGRNHSYTALRVPIAYLTESESELVARHGLSCPAISDDILYISPQLKAYRCPLLLNADRVSYRHLNDALQAAPLDDLECLPDTARCPILGRGGTGTGQLIEACKLVKLTVNEEHADSNTPVWSDILRGLAGKEWSPEVTGCHFLVHP